MESKEKRKRKPLFIAGIAALSLLAAVGIIFVVFFLIVFFEGDDDETDLRTHNAYLSEDRSGFTGSLIQEMPVEEIETLVDGVDDKRKDASATVVVNGADISSNLTVKEYDGALYAAAKPFAEAFADRGASASNSTAPWSDPGHGGQNTSNLPPDSQQFWDIPMKLESDALIEDWSEGPTSLWIPMEATEVVGGITGTYVGYYKYTRYQIVVVFNEDNVTGYWEQMDPAWPAHRFEFYFLFDRNHPMIDNTYNGMIFADCVEDGHSDHYEFVVVSPTVLYEPATEAIFYKVD